MDWNCPNPRSPRKNTLHKNCQRKTIHSYSHHYAFARVFCGLFSTPRELAAVAVSGRYSNSVRSSRRVVSGVQQMAVANVTATSYDQTRSASCERASDSIISQKSFSPHLSTSAALARSPWLRLIFAKRTTPFWSDREAARLSSAGGRRFPASIRPRHRDCRRG